MANNNDDQISVKLGADTGDLKPGMDKAAGTVEQSTARIREAIAKMRAETQAHFTAMKEHINTSSGQMKGAMDGVQGAFSAFQSKIGMITAVLAGGAVFKSAVNEAKAFTGEAMGLAKALGISATEGATLNVALGDVYSSSETMIGAAQMLSRQLKNNEEGLNKMGLSTRDANGHLKPMNALMMDSIKLLQGYKEGTDRTLAAQTMFGRGAAEVNSLLKLNADVLEAAKQKQQELGLTTGKENVEALKEYKAAMNDAGDVVTALKKNVGDALMPVLTKLANWFASTGPAAVTVIKGAIGGVVSIFWGLKNAVVILWETLNAMVVSVAEPIRALAEAIAKAMAGDFAGAKEALMSVPENIKAAWAKAGDEMVASAQETREKIWNLFAAPTEMQATTAKGKEYQDPNKKSNAGAEAAVDKAKLESALALQLEYLKEAQDAYDDAYKQNLITTEEYYAAKRQIEQSALQESINAKKGEIEVMQEAQARANDDKERLKLKAQEIKLTGELTVLEAQRSAAALKNAREETQAIRERSNQLQTIAIQSQQNAAKAEIELQRISLQEKRDLKTVSDQSALEQERDLQTKLYQIDRQALEQQLELEKNGNRDPIKIAQLNAQIEQLAREHGRTMADISRQISVESQRYMSNFFDGMEMGFVGAIDAMLIKFTSFKTAMFGLMQAIYASFINEMIAKPLAMAAMRVVRESALYQALAGEKVATDTAATAEQMAAQQTLGITGVMSNAALAATAAMASVAAIPVVGWAMAPEVGAGTYALAMGYLPSASKGYDIPAGVNPLTQLHQKEMVLPAEHADTIRSLKGGGGGGGTVNIKVTAMDGADAKRVLIRNRDALAQSMGRAMREFKGV